MKINSFNDLQAVKQDLLQEIKEQEEQITNDPILRIPAAIFKGTSIKSGIKESLESISLEDYKKAAFNAIGTVLMANRRTRKFFVAFIIAKEMVPFALEKINEYLKK